VELIDINMNVHARLRSDQGEPSRLLALEAVARHYEPATKQLEAISTEITRW